MALAPTFIAKSVASADKTAVDAPPNARLKGNPERPAAGILETTQGCAAQRAKTGDCEGQRYAPVRQAAEPICVSLSHEAHQKRNFGTDFLLHAIQNAHAVTPLRGEGWLR
ncbi:hypothetical protein AVS7_04441 [Acidovorax sp. MR-S7]|nr:hypothetical protein AVS7_04441 [Acidovorax sp. MR-S7]